MMAAFDVLQVALLVLQVLNTGAMRQQCAVYEAGDSANEIRAASAQHLCSVALVSIHSTSEFVKHGKSVCTNLLQPDVYWDSQHLYRMDAYIPAEILGSILVQMPHQLSWDETIDVTFMGPPAHQLEFYIFWNTATLDQWQNDWHVSHDHAVFCMSELTNQSRALSFTGPFRGPQYDHFSSQYPGHGDNNDMWRGTISLDGDGLGQVSFTTKAICLETVGFAMKGLDAVLLPTGTVLTEDRNVVLAHALHCRSPGFHAKAAALWSRWRAPRGSVHMLGVAGSISSALFFCMAFVARSSLPWHSRRDSSDGSDADDARARE